MFVLVSIVSMLIVLGIMVLVHEAGHFFAAKACGVRVEVFSIGFGPRLFGVTRGDTDYRVSFAPALAAHHHSSRRPRFELSAGLCADDRPLHDA
jgi:hypothetical protein